MRITEAQFEEVRLVVWVTSLKQAVECTSTYYIIQCIVVARNNIYY